MFELFGLMTAKLDINTYYLTIVVLLCPAVSRDVTPAAVIAYHLRRRLDSSETAAARTDIIRYDEAKPLSSDAYDSPYI